MLDVYKRQRFMFRNCKRLKELDVNGFNTSRVTNMGCMFGGCKQLRQLDLSGFDTSQVTDMRFMFGECRQLRRLNVSGFDTSQAVSYTHLSALFSSKPIATPSSF